MVRSLKLTLENDEVKFTPDGQISVVDAIGALSSSEDPDAIWDHLVANHPEVLTYCERFRYKDEIILVADAEGWEKIETILFDYLIDQWREAV